MSAFLWRVLIVVICVVILQALIPPLLRILGISIDGDVLTVVRICIVGLAVLYLAAGFRALPPVA